MSLVKCNDVALQPLYGIKSKDKESNRDRGRESFEVQKENRTTIKSATTRKKVYANCKSIE